MFTSQAASMLRTLDGAMPNTSLRDMVQIFANCSQSLTHRGGTDLSPPAFPYLKNGVNTKAPLSWNPDSPGYNLGPSNNNGYYNNVGGSPYYDFSSGDYKPFFEGPSNFSDNSSWNARNENSYSFPFAQNIRSDNLYGGPTFNVAGDSYFDNSHADTYNGDTVNTNNINVGTGSIKFGDTYVDNSVVRNYFGDQNGGNNIGNINLIDLINQFNRRIPTSGIANASRRKYVEKCYYKYKKFAYVDPVPTKLDLASHLKLFGVPEFTGTEVNLTIDSAMTDASMTGKIKYDKPPAGAINVPVTLEPDSPYSIPNYTGTVNLTGNIPYPTLDKTSADIGNGWSVAGVNGTVAVAAVTANFVAIDVPTKWYLDTNACTVTATTWQTFLVVSSLNGGGGGNATFSIPAQPCYATSVKNVVTSASLSEGTKTVSALTATLATGKAYEIQKIKLAAAGALQLQYTSTDAVTSGFTIKNPTVTSTCKYTPEGTVTSPDLENTGGDLEIPSLKQDATSTTILTGYLPREALFLDNKLVTLR